MPFGIKSPASADTINCSWPYTKLIVCVEDAIYKRNLSSCYSIHEAIKA